jgi:cation/acetate symporter
VTWTQVAQYIMLIIAFLTPVFWLSVKQTGTAWPPLGYGTQLERIAERERALEQDPREIEVRQLQAQRAADMARKLADVPAAMAEDRERLAAEVQALRRQGEASRQLQQAERQLAARPQTEAAAAAQYQRAYDQAQRMAAPLAGMAPHAVPYAAGDPNGTPRERAAYRDERINFLALVLCLMLGTAAMPHVLTRYCTTPSTSEARRSVGWSLFFIALLYLAAPALAAIVKYEVFSHLVGQPFSSLPAWIGRWSRLDPSLVSVEDVNGDGLLQLSELWLAQDAVVLAAPEIGGLPLVVTYLVAAGGLAAALSTADGLLLTISNALSHDLYYRVFRPQARAIRRVMLSKFLVLIVALLAAYLAAQRTADILQFVSVAFSIAASAFFPALVLGVFWRGATRQGATWGMLAGLGTTLACLLLTHARLRGVLGWPEVGAGARWWGIDPVAAGVFGVPVGVLTIVLVSAVDRALQRRRHAVVSQAAIDRMRDPRRDGAFEDSLY